IDCKSHARQQSLAGQKALTCEAASLREPEPGLDAALRSFAPVVIGNAVEPGATHVTFRTVRQDRRVLDGDVSLVVEAIHHPASDLVGGKSAGVHPHMKGM